MCELGYVEYDAAVQSLKDSELSLNPEREYNLAIGHLQSAYQVFRKLSKFELSYLLGDIGDLVLRAGHRDITANQSACETAILIASCYYTVGDKKLMSKYIGIAQEHFSAYKSHTQHWVAMYERSPIRAFFFQARIAELNQNHKKLSKDMIKLKKLVSILND